MHILRAASLIAVIGAGTLLGGCATRESVEHAQATADQADRDASSAHGAADRAQSSADAAGKTANDAMTLAQNANDKVDKVIAEMEKRRQHTAMLHRHHRRHLASAEPNQANCPAPPQQKSELKTPKHKMAAVLQPKHDRKVQTAQNKTAQN